MPFTSKRQQRAAFGGHIPGFSKKKAKEWADKTDFSGLPDRAPAEKGKRTLRTKEASPRIGHILSRLRAKGYKGPEPAAMVVDEFYDQLDNQIKPLTALGSSEASERRRKRKTAGAALFSLCTKLAMPVGNLVPTPTNPVRGTLTEASASKASKIGNFGGRATANSLKPPGRALSSSIMNPRRNLRQAMTAFAK